MQISAGKLRSLRRLADADGRFKMVAVDQRPPMLKSLPAKLGRPAEYADLGAVKATLARHLMPHGSALLIDPDYGYSIAESAVPPNKGLLITLEDFNFEESPGGRKTAIMKDWGVGKIKRMGADGVKLLLWYRPDGAADVVAHQKALVKHVGEECRRYDIPFLLELLVFPFKGSAAHTTDYTEDKDKYPELVLQSLKDFSGEEYGVDIYKLESPVVASALPDPDGAGADTAKVQGLFNEMAGLIDKPWVMLSAGAGMDVFRRVLTYAYRAGANGYLAGRAIWWPAFELLPDQAAMEARLSTEAVRYMQEINALTVAEARPWPMAPAISGKVELADAGQAFPQSYPAFAAG